MITLVDIHVKLAEAIRTSGLTQSRIANEIGVTQSSVAHYIKGDKMPALDTFANLCSVLDLDANDILCIQTSDK